MPSRYVKPSDYPVYGLPGSTTVEQVYQASTLVDAFLQRPEGLVYIADDLGNPVCMEALAVTQSFNVAAGLAPGANVVATVTGPVQTLQRGTVLIASRAIPAKREPLIVASVAGSQVTFVQVTKNHDPAVALESGLTIFEQKNLPDRRPLMVLAKAPVVRILQAAGRYGYRRRGSNNAFAIDEFNLLAAMAQFGGPPMWENINVTATDFNPETGQVWIPSGVMLAYYSEVRINYVAGYVENAIPEAIKLATAKLVYAQKNTPMEGNVKLLKAGDTQIERFLSSVLDSDVKDMLRPYRVRAYA